MKLFKVLAFALVSIGAINTQQSEIELKLKENINKVA